MKSQLTVRPSRHEDKTHILEFCEHTFNWGDYIPSVWDTWIKDTDGQLFTALVGNQPIGLMRVSIAKAGEAWLQAARTHPSHRRLGVATALTRACLQWAKARGAEVARLATDSDNVPAQTALQKLTFNKVSDFLVMKCPRLRPQLVQSSRWAEDADMEGAWRLLQHSTTYAESAGLCTIVFTWFSLGKQGLAEFIHTGRAVVHETSRVIDGLTLVDATARDAWPEENPLQTCYIDGHRQAVMDMMNFLKNYASGQGFRNLYAFACNTPLLAAALAETGFAPESTTELIYEKQLGHARLATR